jgi:hypothetical protein
MVAARISRTLVYFNKIKRRKILEGCITLKLVAVRI